MLNAVHSFADRRDAGQRLAVAVAKLNLSDPIVYALPRGGVPVAFEVARALKAPLELLLVHKLGAPGHEEYAIGAVVDGAEPQLVLDEDAMRVVHPSPAYVEAEKQRQLVEIERRRRAYLGDRTPIPVAGRTAVVVDDGIATGSTMRAAIQGLRTAKAGRIVVAVPVAPREAAAHMRTFADDVVCLETPDPFFAVGEHYGEFGQLADSDVTGLLRAAERR
jgi:putative phosphoribosyl transferase